MLSMMIRTAKRLAATLAAISLISLWCRAALGLDASSSANSYAHTAIRIRDGFPKAPVVAFAQTPDGYLWLGTQLGLFRFDGVRGVAWPQLTGRTLPSDWAGSLLASRNGALWIGSNVGLVRWDDGKLIEYPALRGLGVHSLLEDRDGTIWVAAESEATSTGRLCAIRGGVVVCYGEDGRFGSSVYDLLRDDAGRLWLVASNGLWRWSPGVPTVYSRFDVRQNAWPSLAATPERALVVSSPEGIRLLEQGTFHEIPVSITVSQGERVRILVDHKGALWVGTQSQGLVRIEQGHMDRFDTASGLSGDNVLALFEDHEGDVWASTENGLDRFHEVAARMISTEQDLSPGDVSAVIASKDGSLWMTTPSGLFRWADGDIVAYRRRHEHVRGKSSQEPPSTKAREILVRGLPKGTFGSLFEDSHGRLWLGSSAGLGYMENNRYVSVPGISTDPRALIHGFAEDASGNIWISQRAVGLIRVSPGGQLQTLSFKQLGIGEIWRLVFDPWRGGLWLGSVLGTIAYFEHGKISESYSVGAVPQRKAVNELRVDPHGTLWASTEAGLAILRSGHLLVLDSRNGLPCDDVRGTMDDNDSSYWLYTACGLIRIKLASLDSWSMSVISGGSTTLEPRPPVLDATDALTSFASRSSLSPKVAKTPDGRLWFATTDGVVVLDPRALPRNALQPPVHIEQVVADRQSYEPSPRLHLPPLIRNLEIDYTALSLVAPEKNQFRYKLEGHDRDWESVGNRRQAFYTDLPPGNYRFRVIASNNSGVWNQQGASLDFSIAPAYWQTNWFRATCVATFLLLLWGLYQLRLRQIARAFNARLEERVAERTRIARELHDTLLQSFQGLLLRFQRVHDLLPLRSADAKQILGSAIDRTAQAITDGRNAVQGLRASTLESNDLAESIRTVGEELAAEASGHAPVRLSVEVEGVSRALHPIVRDEVFRIASEALRNACRHAAPQHLEVEIRYDEGQFRLRVRDDGKGIDSQVSAQGRPGHFGLHGMHERAQLVGGKLTVWTAPEAGTEIELTIPSAYAYATTTAPRHGLFAEWRSGKDGQRE